MIVIPQTSLVLCPQLDDAGPPASENVLLPSGISGSYQVMPHMCSEISPTLPVMLLFHCHVQRHWPGCLVQFMGTTAFSPTGPASQVSQPSLVLLLCSMGAHHPCITVLRDPEPRWDWGCTSPLLCADFCLLEILQFYQCRTRLFTPGQGFPDDMSGSTQHHKINMVHLIGESVFLIGI